MRTMMQYSIQSNNIRGKTIMPSEHSLGFYDLNARILNYKLLPDRKNPVEKQGFFLFSYSHLPMMRRFIGDE